MCTCDYHNNISRNDAASKKIALVFPKFAVCKLISGERHVGIIEKFEVAVGRAAYIRLDDGSVKPYTLKNATTQVFNKANQKEKGTTHNMNIWYINVNGEDVPFSQLLSPPYEINNHGPSISFTQSSCTYIEKKDTSRKKRKRNVSIKLKGAQQCTNVSELSKTMSSIQVNTKRINPIQICRKEKVQKVTDEESAFFEDSEDEEDETEFTWNPESDYWTQELLEQFVSKFPEKAPPLVRIEDEYRSNSFPKNIGLPIYLCVFLTSKGIEKKECLSLSAIYLVPEYKNFYTKNNLLFNNYS